MSGYWNPECIDEEGFDMSNYNCGGYALKTKDWYIPTPGQRPLMLGKCDYCDNYDDCEDCEYNNTPLNLDFLMEEAVNHMLAEFPNLRIVSSEAELKSFETLVIFRLGRSDFHYVRKERDGRYYHKRGWNPEIEEMPEEEVYGSSWCYGKYDGPMTLFGYDERQKLRNAI